MSVERFPTSLKCNVDLVDLESKISQNIKNYKDATLSLGRDSFKDLVILIEQKSNSRKIVLGKELKFYKSCAKEGKAGFEVVGKKRFLINNAAPQPLTSFLSLIALKSKKTNQNKGFVASANHRLNNGFLGSGFNEISPLTNNEINQYGNTGQLRKSSESDISSTPKGPGLKRKQFSAETDFDSDSASICSGSFSVKSSQSNSTSITSQPLNSEQQYVVSCVLQGQSIFFTGSAGTGKSFLLKKLISHLAPETTVVAASTGMAACQISGTTFHSFAGIGTGSESYDECLNRVMSKPAVVKNYRKCRTLIIDEISMIDGDFFDKVEYVARSVNRNDKPFGGIQLVLSGDFLQLPPVNKPGEAVKKFCFEAGCWNECINKSIELRTVKRQSDEKFIKILQLMRIGQLSDNHKKILLDTASQNIEKNGIKATILCTHKEDSNAINESRLDSLDGQENAYSAVDSGDKAKLNVLTNAKDRLVLRVGAQVMLTKNMSTSQGLVNGARGVVIGFNPKRKNYPVVKFVSGVERTIEPAKWIVKQAFGSDMVRTQIPLALAWSISIHKSQGMTLDCVSVSLSKVFECGQAYVALSRAKSLDTLKVLDLNDNSVRANPRVVKYYVSLRKNAMGQMQMQPMALGEKFAKSTGMLKRMKTM